MSILRRYKTICISLFVLGLVTVTPPQAWAAASCQNDADQIKSQNTINTRFCAVGLPMCVERIAQTSPSQCEGICKDATSALHKCSWSMGDWSTVECGSTRRCHEGQVLIHNQCTEVPPGCDDCVYGGRPVQKPNCDAPNMNFYRHR